jgi:flagellar protein FlgJ
MKTTVPKSEDDENEYMQYFGDTLYQEYADGLAENGSLGIAQTLFESMRHK